MRWRLLLLVLVLAAARLRAGESPVLVALVIDTSGSVPAAALAGARDTMVRTLEALPPGSEVAVFTFDDESRLVVPRTSQADAVRKALTELRARGRFTALNDAIYDASRYVASVPHMRRAIVIVSDGRDENSALNPDDGLAIVEQARIPVFAVGVGKVDEKTMRRIAKLSGGSYIAPGSLRPADLTRGILTTAATPPPPVTVASAAPTSPAPVGGVGTRPLAPVSAPAPAGRPLWPFALVAALALGGLGLLAWRMRLTSTGPACTTCGRPLAGPLSPCAFCAREQRDEDTAALPRPPGLAEPEPEPEGEEDAPIVPDISATVAERLNMTEEYLEKTITLRERPVLVVESGPATGQAYELNLDSATSLGRSRANDVVVQDVAVSSQHCRVRPTADHKFEVLDLKSTNGTYVNERRVTRQKLTEGDALRIGDTVFKYRLHHRVS